MRGLAVSFLISFLCCASALADASIIGGEDVDSSDPVASTTVALTFRNGFVCSASVVDDDLIVTAAHCATRGLTAVFSTRASDRAAPRRVIDAFEQHPKWGTVGRGKADRYDIALLKFSGGIPTGFKTARLMPSNWKVSDGQDVLVAGYGANAPAGDTGTGVLRKVRVRVADAQYGQTEITMDQTAGRGACHGDSGGPAFWVRNGTYYLLGLTNRGRDERECEGETVFALINAHLRWLVETADRLRSTPALRR